MLIANKAQLHDAEKDLASETIHLNNGYQKEFSSP